jgi:stage II sporulation protein R
VENHGGYFFMKKVCIIFLLSIIISLTAFGLLGEKTQNHTFNAYMVGSFLEKEGVDDEYLRIHIRADSNQAQAQAVKYYVRDALVEYLTPLVAEYENREEAACGVEKHLEELSALATRVLKERGFSYGATALLRVEEFPTRVYDGYTLPSGKYLALIVCLGSGAGDNWWCVVYPPLCFAADNGQSVIYKSKIKEIIENWKK